ncbi:MAG: phosphoribosylformylglycinamidine synthase [Aureispira sp.]|nr:phosphoribosylformylglycinamidine synthase [Aureispira sp.]
MSSYQTIQVLLNSNIRDVKGQKVAQKCQTQLNIETGKVQSTKLYSVNYALSNDQVQAFGEHCIKDQVTDNILVNELYQPTDYACAIAIAKLPGVTDDEGTSAQMALADFLNIDIDVNTQHIFSQEIYFFQNELNAQQLQLIAKRILGNPLINHFTFATKEEGKISFAPYVPKVQMTVDDTTEYIDLELSDEELIHLSKTKVLALNLAEMKAVRDYYRNEDNLEQRSALGLSKQPTDCELEILAQTWSEHCKHKEFNAVINYENKETGETKKVNSLFKTYIKGATDKVMASLTDNNNDWVVKVFTDNAGVVKATKDKLFVWKVETHNSPSALDPYGGAITGILGNNRDPLGTGVGGAKLLFNTNVLCFGPPSYDKPLLSGQLHPRQIMEGVVSGIEDGGNKSGVPTVNGSVVFDERYAGKPLVYCGTGGLMDYDYHGAPSWEKPIDDGDMILVAGGRVGKDGIHGATFSSIEIDEHSPMSAVQIGSPITQKKASDFMIIACQKGLVKCSTDNGAGGLSSSIGELATISNGAVVHLEKVPLKYSGLKPWEIFVSESQERMTIVAEQDKYEELAALAKLMEVELTDIGRFTNTGVLEVCYNNKHVAALDMEFLHDGVPQKIMEAVWEKPELHEPELATDLDYNKILLQLMGSLNICSRESIIRQYDHEVKGKTIIKPLMGPEGKAPQDAAIVRIGFDSYEGIAVSNGILPRYGDIDAYQMSAGAFDEAVRQIISTGGSLPNTQEKDGIFWSINDNFCVPDSDYNAETNPDGKIKCAKLVQMCEALYDMATYFDIPLTSGKDSMKNDFKADGVKISVPATILYSMSSKIQDVRKTITSEFKAAGDLVYVLGTTYDELGASEFYSLFGELGANVPLVHKEVAKTLYKKVMAANAKGLISSSHDISDGGLAVTLVESAFGGQLGVDVDLASLGDLPLNAKLFSESHSRFVVSIRPEDKEAFEVLLGDQAYYLGTVTAATQVNIQDKGAAVVDLPVQELLESWSNGLIL